MPASQASPTNYIFAAKSENYLQVTAVTGESGHIAAGIYCKMAVERDFRATETPGDRPVREHKVGSTWWSLARCGASGRFGTQSNFITPKWAVKPARVHTAQWWVVCDTPLLSFPLLAYDCTVLAVQCTMLGCKIVHA